MTSNSRLFDAVEKCDPGETSRGTNSRIKLKRDITKILYDKGYILNYKFVDDGPQGSI